MLKRLIGVVLGLMLVCPLAAQDESFGDKIRSLLDEATELYKRGRHAEAHDKFEAAFQMKPSSDLVYAHLQRVGMDIVAGMMNAPDRKIQDDGRRLFELAKPGEPLREGREVIAKYLEDLKSTEHAVYLNGRWHLKNFGSYAVQPLVALLADQQHDMFRSRAILLMTEMGVDASLAAIEALDAKDPFLRQQAAVVLGNIKDERAIPALKRAYENANEPPEVKKFADEALRKIMGNKEPGQWKPAAEYYYELAMKFYYSHPTAVFSWQRDHLIWKWDSEKEVLTERRVPRMLFNEQLAEEALFDLLAVNPNFTDPQSKMSAWSLLACVEFAQALEARATVEAALDALKSDEIDAAGLARLVREIEGLSEASGADLTAKITGAANPTEVKALVSDYFDTQAKAIRAEVMARLPGRQYLYEALGRCLEDGNYPVAAACLEAIGEMGRAEDLPSPPAAPAADAPRNAAPVEEVATIGQPLVLALTNEDKRVRYAAARVMARLNPQQLRLGWELVIPNLVDAVGEQGIRVALVIYDVQDDNDRNFINAFKKTLVGLNVFPVIATSGSEGIVKAKQFPTEDVILVQRKIAGQVYFRESDVSKPIVESVFDTLRDDIRTRAIPRLILADNAQEAEQATKDFVEKGTAAGVVGRDTHKLDIQALLERLFSQPEAKKDSKDRADVIAAQAAESLAGIDPVSTLYPFRNAVEALIRTVSPEILREDSVRIPACRALGRFGDQRAVDVLAKVIRDKDEDATRAARQKGVRLAAAQAISQVFRQTEVAPSEDVFKALMETLRDGDIEIENACAEALGNATLSPEQRLKVSLYRRVVRDAWAPGNP